MRILRYAILFLLAIGAIFLLGQSIKHFFRPRVVVRTTVPNVVEFCVVQKFSGEPFTTSCYYRKPGGPWGWFYYDHEDDYWDKGAAEVDPETKQIRIIRDGRVTVKFDWETEIYRKIEKGGNDRTTTGAQSWMPYGWEPPH